MKNRLAIVARLGLFFVLCCSATLECATTPPAVKTTASAAASGTSAGTTQGAVTTAIHVGFVCKNGDLKIEDAKAKLTGFPTTYLAWKISDISYDSNPAVPLTCWKFIGWTTGATKMIGGKNYLFEKGAADALMAAIMPVDTSAMSLPTVPTIVLEAKFVCSNTLTPDIAKQSLVGGTVVTQQPTTISTLAGQKCFIVAKSDVGFKVKRNNVVGQSIQDIAKQEIGVYMRCGSNVSCPQLPNN